MAEGGSGSPEQQSAWIRAIKAAKLNGLKQATSSDLPLWARCLWLVLFTGVFSFGIVLSVHAAQEYLRRPILHTFHDGGVSIHKTPFPAMTVSSPYMFRKKTLDQAEQIYGEVRFENETDRTFADGTEWDIREASKLAITIEHICESSTSYAKQFGMSDDTKIWHSEEYMEWIQKQHLQLVDDVQDKAFREKVFPFIKKGLTNCSEIITACRWKGSQKMACNELISTVQTDVGVGCSFNKMPDDILRKDNGLKKLLYERGSGMKDESDLWTAWDIDTHPFLEDNIKANRIPFTQKVAGKNKGFSFTLNYGMSNDGIACPIFDSIGKMITFHSPIDEPSVLTQGINIPPGREVFIKIYPEVTIADPKIRGINIVDRKCYFQDESPLTIYGKYTQRNCLNECVAKRIYQACNCFPLSMTAGNNETICGPLEQECVIREIEKIDDIGYEGACQKPRCYQPCTELTYRAEMTSSELLMDDPSAERRISIVHAYIAEESIVSHERTHHQDFSEVFGIVGGVMGLTNGIDLMHVLGILQGLLILVCAPYKPLKRLCGIWLKYLRSKFQLISKKKPECPLPVQDTPAASDQTVEFIRVRPRQDLDSQSDHDGALDLGPPEDLGDLDSAQFNSDVVLDLRPPEDLGDLDTHSNPDAIPENLDLEPLDEPEPSFSANGARIDYVDLYLGKLM